MIQVHVWSGVPATRAFLRVATDRGPGFRKVVGTARGFGLRSTDLHRWLLVTDRTTDEPRWTSVARESAVLTLEPLSSRGSWSGWAPVAAPRDWSGPVVSLTRARLRPLRERRFRQSVPPVAGQLVGSAVQWWTGFGEAPVGFQGTLSVWPSAAALRDFAHRDAHRAVVARTPREQWYAEELFTRCALVGAVGALDGAPASDLLGT